MRICRRKGGCGRGVQYGGIPVSLFSRGVSSLPAHAGTPDKEYLPGGSERGVLRLRRPCIASRASCGVPLGLSFRAAHRLRRKAPEALVRRGRGGKPCAARRLQVSRVCARNAGSAGALAAAGAAARHIVFHVPRHFVPCRYVPRAGARLPESGYALPVSRVFPPADRGADRPLAGRRGTACRPSGIPGNDGCRTAPVRARPFEKAPARRKRGGGRERRIRPRAGIARHGSCVARRGELLSADLL